MVFVADGTVNQEMVLWSDVRVYGPYSIQFTHNTVEYLVIKSFEKQLPQQSTG
jgi:hypothetical protein